MTLDPARKGGGACALTLFVSALFPAPIHGQGAPSSLPAPRSAPAFVENAGQWPARVAFRARGGGGLWAWLHDRGWTAQLQPAPHAPPPAADAIPGRVTRPQERLADATPAAPTGAAVVFAPLGGSFGNAAGERVGRARHHYFVGNNRDRWARDVRTFARVRCTSVWPGVDLVFRDGGGFVEYDVELDAGRTLAGVAFTVDGANGPLTIDADGGLRIPTAAGDLVQTPPRAFTVATDGSTTDVACRFALLGPDRYGFVAPDAPRGGTDRFVVDPGLVWSTYLGSFGQEEPYGVESLGGGRAALTGWTASPRFPTTAGAYATTMLGGWDGFVSILDTDAAPGSQLESSTFFGGSLPAVAGRSGGDSSLGLHVAADGTLTACGFTECSDFPIANPATAAFATPRGGETDGFVVSLDATASNLLYSSYLGGTTRDTLWSVHRDAAGVLTVAGDTWSTDFPTAGTPFQATFGGGISDAVFARIDTATAGAAALTYSTFVGGDGDDFARDVSVDATGRAAIVGEAGAWISTAFPTVNAIQTAFRGGFSDVFAGTFDAANVVPWLTLLGGIGSDSAWGTHIDDATGNVTLCGNATPPYPTTPGAFQFAYGGGTFDAMVTRLRGNGTLDYSSFLGGPNQDFANDLHVDAGGIATIAGEAQSQFPTTRGTPRITDMSGDAFVARHDLGPGTPRAQRNTWATGFGGTAGATGSRDWAHHAVADADDGSVFAVGGSFATNLPIKRGRQTTQGGQYDTWSARFVPSPGFAPFGRGCPDSNGTTPSLGALGPPRLGQRFDFDLANLPPGMPAGLLAGISDTASGPLTLPFDLGRIGMPNCTLYVSSEVAYTLNPTGTTLQFGFQLPLQGNLFGICFVAQVVTFAPGANALGLVTSNAAMGVVGN